ncbi:sensor histidine kinase [Salana multivorans]
MSQLAGQMRWAARVLPIVGAPAAITVLTIAGAIQTHRLPALAAGLGVVVIATGVVAIWIDADGWRLTIALGVLAVAVAIACWGDPRNLGWFGMCVVAGWGALVLPPRWAVVLGATLAVFFLLMLVLVSTEPGWVTWTLGVTLTTGAFVFVRRQRELVDRLREAQSELAERARTDERHRIAREMHDLVGHSLTVALLHLGSARLALDDDVDAARAALTQAERAARHSLDDVRSAVALLRSPDPTAEPPAPGIEGVPDLVDSYRDAGAKIDLQVTGIDTALPASRSLAVYRIVQESLTNAIRHGDGGPISVRIGTNERHTTIAVRNGGRTRGRRSAGTGITAMSERATALGGTLAAGPTPGGWLVEAVIPA